MLQKVCMYTNTTVCSFYSKGITTFIKQGRIKLLTVCYIVTKKSVPLYITHVITHVTPLFINLHWLPIAARIKFKALMFAYRTTSGSAPLYLNSLLQTYMPSRSLHSASVPSQRVTKSLSQTFSLTVPVWCNALPNSIRAAESLPIFKKRLKTHLFHLYLTL